MVPADLSVAVIPLVGGLVDALPVAGVAGALVLSDASPSCHGLEATWEALVFWARLPRC